MNYKLKLAEILKVISVLFQAGTNVLLNNLNCTVHTYPIYSNN